MRSRSTSDAMPWPARMVGPPVASRFQLSPSKRQVSPTENANGCTSISDVTMQPEPTSCGSLPLRPAMRVTAIGDWAMANVDATPATRPARARDGRMGFMASRRHRARRWCRSSAKSGAMHRCGWAQGMPDRHAAATPGPNPGTWVATTLPPAQVADGATAHAGDDGGLAAAAPGRPTPRSTNAWRIATATGVDATGPVTRASALPSSACGTRHR